MMQFKEADLIVVGGGYFGLTVARLAAEKVEAKVLILEKRATVGGHASSHIDSQTGIEVHTHGSHIFHTNDAEVWRFMNRFSGFNDYRHHVYTQARGKTYSMPINLQTLTAFYERALTPDEAAALVAAQAKAERIEVPANLEERALSQIGRPLYETLIRGYTLKQWATDPRQLPAETIARLPVRYVFNGRYFSDQFEGVPLLGYTPMLQKMAEHPNIDVRSNCDFFACRSQIPAATLVVYTGPLDRYFGYQHGPLGWRAIRLENEVRPTGNFQGTSVMNYADLEVPWTRIHEFRHFNPERNYPPDQTIIAREFSCLPDEQIEPAYPIGTATDRLLLSRYQEMAQLEKNVVFGGRLGTYSYLNMDQVVRKAMDCFESSVAPRLLETKA